MKKYMILALSVMLVANCTMIGNQINRKSDYSSKLSLSKEAQDLLLGNTLPVDSTLETDALIIQMALNSGTGQNSTEFQRAMATALIIRSDTLCENYMTNIVTTANSLSSTFSLSSLALTAAAGVSSPVRSANLLSEIATFSTGAETALSKTILSGKEPNLIYRAVMAERAQERAKLLTLLGADDIKLSGVISVMGQLANYHSKCGIVVGTASVDEAISEKRTKAQDAGSEKANEEIAKIKAQQAKN